MTHKELQGTVNKELGKANLLVSLTPERGKRVTVGLSSGSMLLNNALSGTPFIGYAWGHMLELYGPAGAGKTTLALHAILEAQKLEKVSKKKTPCLFVDAEHSLDLGYAEALGIDINNLSFVQPDCGEDGLSAVEAGIKVGYKLVVVDSVAALTPMAEIEGEMGQSHMGLLARLMSQACRKLTGVCYKSQAIIIFINQIRMNIGIVFGNPEVTPGGKALKFYSTYRLEVRAPRTGKKTGKTLMGMGAIEETTELGTVANIKVVKNKVFPPHRLAQVYIEYGKGIDRYKDAVDFLVYAGAFKSTKTKKGKVDMLLLPSKNKKYTFARVLKLMRYDIDVQRDVINIIKDLDTEEKE